MVVMGHVRAPYGIRGWVHVAVYTEALDSLLDYPSWWLNLGGEWKEYAMLDAHVHGKGLVAHLQGVDDREAALALRGSEVGVPREELPAPEEDEYYWQDLVGLKVVNLQNEPLGVVADLMETGANDILVVRDGGERLIPFVDAVIREVDLVAGVIRVDWGLDY